MKWGPLTVLEPLGQGAFGTVFRARDALEREVALKLLSVGRDLGADAADRLVREGRLLARVKHEHVVDVYGVDCVDGAVGLWMEFVARPHARRGTDRARHPGRRRGRTGCPHAVQRTR